ncbi:ragulator complex protein LAMTOR1 [Toxorhynchites rutilus septentrionalis]|uniref:ragulator complex protein LAMTOR1 n=1 Tax=Toxorhynchites rutilus septentrionalis TaxID=329112 RepID=UPI00247A48E5|nr:ragulator complex protein LAMTOR1 [Toxorhynchites rutilus septentrionalis]
MDCFRSLVNYAVSCFICQEDSSAQGNEPNERTHLLDNPVSSSPAVRTANSEDLTQEYPSSVPKKDDVSALNKIIQDTAANVIDVAAMDIHNIEPHEYNDRVKIYSQRLAQQWNTVQHPNSVCHVGLLKDIPNPEVVLTSVPIPSEDLYMIRSMVQKANTAVAGIKVNHTEKLVVPFRIP